MRFSALFLTATLGLISSAVAGPSRMADESSLQARTYPSCPAGTRRDGPHLNGPNCVNGADGQCCPVYGKDNFCEHKACLAVAGHPDPTFKQCGSCPIKGSYPDKHGACVCPAGQSVVEGCCVANKPPKCAAPKTLQKGKCLPCPKGQTYDYEKSKCLINAGQPCSITDKSNLIFPDPNCQFGLCLVVQDTLIAKGGYKCGPGL